MPRPARSSVLVLALLSLCVPDPATTQATPPACSADEHRAFDFWEGSWEVQAQGGIAGHNTIRVLMNGCVLHEHYTTPAGYEGESLNVYDASRGLWHQTWVDNGGLLLLLEGGFEDGAMVMQGTTVGADGAETMQRITWSRVDGDPDRVRQHWQSSTDGGRTWSTAFDGLYVRREGP